MVVKYELALPTVPTRPMDAQADQRIRRPAAATNTGESAMFFKLKPSNRMKFNSRFQVVHLRWWHKPIPLYDKDDKDNYRRIGWVWNQKAYVVDNMVEGWVAFAKDQTPENIDVWWCSCCGMALDGITRERLEKAIKERP